jgi:hypothetical protein
MRTPTSDAQAYRWHRLTLEAKENRARPPAVHSNDPQCGWFTRVLEKNGDPVPCRIWLESEVDPVTGELVGDEVMRCEVNGRRRDPASEWDWLCGKPISEDRYMDMIAGNFRGVAQKEPPASLDPAVKQAVEDARRDDRPQEPAEQSAGKPFF